MKPEPSELVLWGCRSPPLDPPGPRRFLKKSSKNSSKGEPGGNCGIAPLPSPPPLASTVCEVEMLTTESITLSATSAMPSGPRASAGAAIRAPAAPRQMAASKGRRRWLNAGIAPVMSHSLLGKNGSGFEVHSAPEQGCGASIRADFPDAMKPRRLRRKTDAVAHDGVDLSGFGP